MKDWFRNPRTHEEKIGYQWKRKNLRSHDSLVQFGHHPGIDLASDNLKQSGWIHRIINCKNGEQRSQVYLFGLFEKLHREISSSRTNFENGIGGFNGWLNKTSVVTCELHWHRDKQNEGKWITNYKLSLTLRMIELTMFGFLRMCWPLSVLKGSAELVH